MGPPPRRGGAPLDARLGVPYATLDAQFLDFMKAMPRPSAPRP